MRILIHPTVNILFLAAFVVPAWTGVRSAEDLSLALTEVRAGKEVPLAPTGAPAGEEIPVPQTGARADDDVPPPVSPAELIREAMAVTIGERAPLADQLPDGRTRVAWMDFGPRSHVARGSIPVGARSPVRTMSWTGGMIRDRARKPVMHPELHDFVEGHDATFVVGVHPPEGDYRFVVTLGDPDHARGPVRLLANGVVVADSVSTRPGETLDVGFDVVAVGGQVAFRIEADACGRFAVISAKLFGPPGSHLVNLYEPDVAGFRVPAPDSLPALGRGGARSLLENMCDFLIREQPADGGFSYHGLWYQAAYATRSLLAGGLILRRQAYIDSAVACLDRFVANQHEDGRWSASYFGRPCAAAPDTSTANLADVGSMTHCLALAVPHVDPARRQWYLAALQAFADSIVLPAQLDTGAFPNLRFGGKEYRHPYSVATGCQISTLTALYAVTKEKRYLRAAEKAALWLTDRFLPDGYVTFHHHDDDRTETMGPFRFGDLFYVVESLAWAYRYTDQDSVRTRIRDAMDSYVWGEKGLRRATLQGYWWVPQNAWSSSKMGGMLFVLSRYGEMGRRSPELRSWIRNALAWLTDPGRARHIGVMEPPWHLEGDYALPATGFAGVGVASCIDPGVLMPRPKDWRRRG